MTPSLLRRTNRFNSHCPHDMDDQKPPRCTTPSFRPFRPRAGLLAIALAWAAASPVASWAQPSTASPPPLPALGLDANAVTVSGLSSGGYMAAQFSVAYSGSVKGAAIVAGGPYGCSLGSVTSASLTCSCPYELDGDNRLDPTVALERLNCVHLPPRVLADRAIRAWQGNEAFIDPAKNVRQQRIWLYSGNDDPVVDSSIVDGLQQFYAEAKVPKRQIQRVKGPHAGHAMPVAGEAAKCSITRTPYINDCQIDGAGDLLKWLYQQPQGSPGTAQAGSLKPFDQTPYRQSGVFDSLDATGWVYVPAQCEKADARCKLHVAFHGCEQGQNFPTNGQPYGTVFVEQAGYNRWAESMGVVVLYPQILPSTKLNAGSPFEFNPKGCWDFWGYTSPLGDASLFGESPPFARRDAPQMRAVKAMIDALLARPAPATTRTGAM